MKRFSLLLILIASFTVSVYAQINNVVSAINAGSAEQLSMYFDLNIDMKILDKEDVYSKAQAKLLLADFFRTHTPDSFTIFHQGGPESANFAIGNLKSADKKYRVYFLFKKKGEKSYIQKFRIEEDG